nr:hypothetical protein [Deltaproteobacteria bacterium]
MWGRPLAVGIGGELPARPALFDFVCGGKVLDPFGRALGSAALRIHRGAATGFVARRDDGTTDGQTQPPDHHAEIVAARARAEAAQRELASRETAIVRVDRTLPVRPQIWAVWLWPVYWIGRWRARGKLVERRLAALAVDEARRELDTIDRDATAMEAHARLARNRYHDALRALCGGGPTAENVLEVELTLVSGPLPEGIEIVELAGANRAGAETDAVFVVEDGRLLAPVRGGAPLPIGDFAEAVPTLPSVLADARALRVARRVRDRIATALAALEDQLEQHEATFRARLDRVHALRIPDPAAFTGVQLARVRSDISASVNAVMEHAAVHLGSELASLQQDWIGSIANAANTDALKVALARVEAQWDGEPKRIAEEVKVLVMGGVGGSARDLYPDLVSTLVPYGLPAEHARPLRAAPVLPPTPLLPSLSRGSSKLEKQNWFVGLFRSFEARRTEIREHVHDRLEHMREVAEAELRDAEPQLHAVLDHVLRGLLAGAFEHQTAALERMLAAEREAIAVERKTLAPLVRACDDVRTEAARLGELIAQLERHQPAVAIAAAAADTASLSR